jgi:hypothetical protein
MKLEGKVLGYDKKVVAGVVYTLVIILLAFFVGTRYEKNKLTALDQQKTAKAEQKKANPKKSKTAATDVQGAANGQVTPDAQAAPTQTKTPVSTPANGAAPANTVK